MGTLPPYPCMQQTLGWISSCGFRSKGVAGEAMASLAGHTPSKESGDIAIPLILVLLEFN